MKGFLERDLTEAAAEFANCCKLPTNWLRVFDHFVRLALKGLRRGFLKKHIEFTGVNSMLFNFIEITLLQGVLL